KDGGGGRGEGGGGRGGKPGSARTGPPGHGTAGMPCLGATAKNGGSVAAYVIGRPEQAGFTAEDGATSRARVEMARTVVTIPAGRSIGPIVSAIAQGTIKGATQQRFYANRLALGLVRVRGPRLVFL